MNAKGITREEAEPMAAERIRNTYPTYSMVGRGVKELRRFPLVGTFVSFPAEIIRTSFNMLKYMKRDMADPDMASTVPQRALGFAMVSSAAFALQEASKQALDIDDEEEEAIRLLAPNWSRNSNLLFIGRDDEGKLQYMDMSAFDPYNYFKRPINAILRDQPLDDAIVQSASEALDPFFGPDIAAQSITEVYLNEKEGGGVVYNEEDTPSNITAKISEHLIKSIGPSVIQNIKRTSKAIDGDRSPSGKVYKLEDELAAIGGIRLTTLDPKVSLHYKAYDFNQEKRDATKILTSVFRDVNEVEDSELRDAFRRASDARRRAFEKMISIADAARKAGLTQNQIEMVLRNNGISKADAKALASGDVSKWEMSDTTLKKSVKLSLIHI